MTNEMKPCPFCGQAPEISKHYKFNEWSLIHRCKAIGTVSFDFTENKQGLIDRWNTRHTPDVQAELAEAQARIAELEKEITRLKTVPMKYRRMTFNAELQNEVAALTTQLEAARKEIHNLNWALGTEGYDKMATPEEQAAHEAGHTAVMERLKRMEENAERYKLMQKDAERYRFITSNLMFGVHNGYKDGTLRLMFGHSADEAIDAAMKENAE